MSDWVYKSRLPRHKPQFTVGEKSGVDVTSRGCCFGKQQSAFREALVVSIPESRNAPTGRLESRWVRNAEPEVYDVATLGSLAHMLLCAVGHSVVGFA